MSLTALRALQAGNVSMGNKSEGSEPPRKMQAVSYYLLIKRVPYNIDESDIAVSLGLGRDQVELLLTKRGNFSGQAKLTLNFREKFDEILDMGSVVLQSGSRKSKIVPYDQKKKNTTFTELYIPGCTDLKALCASVEQTHNVQIKNARLSLKNAVLSLGTNADAEKILLGASINVNGKSYPVFMYHPRKAHKRKKQSNERKRRTVKIVIPDLAPE
ncbi:hypothetical protein PCE1_000478 [Barthelona sp. PCE]